ncbi:MAG: adenylate/guanylate cyclase domain-containing protein [Spirochaetales bacterium]|nr:adenylate/guanylate cyclase domain-containing protein [Spirochaetales bacterium]
MKSEKSIITNLIVTFTDIHHFLVVVKVLKEKQSDFLQEFYEILGEIVVDHGGELIKYLGDGFLCVFPEDLESEAVASALEMRKAFSKIVNNWKLPSDTELEVGIAGGEIYEGVFGHSSLRQRDIFGDVVNQSAIIGHYRGVAITEWVYERVKDKYTVCRLPDVNLKFQEKPMKVWEVEEQK